MFVKGNQPGLEASIEALFQAGLARNATTTPAQELSSQRVQAIGDWGHDLQIRHGRTHEIGHGRIEERIIEVLAISPEDPRIDWPFVRQVFQVRRHTREKKNGKIRSECVLGVTNLQAEQASPQELLRLSRNHWSIENRSHWVRDVTFDEDRSTVRKRSLPQLMAAVRNTITGALRITGQTNIAAARRTYAMKPYRVLEILQKSLTFE